jgi:hypothetical protein
MPKFRRVSQVDKPQPSLFFDPWAEDSVISNEDGTPKRLYHGTTHDFDTFDPNNPHADENGFWGKGFYFTNSYDDVNTNYANTDSIEFQNKIENKAWDFADSDEFYEMDLEPYRISHPELFTSEGEPKNSYELSKIIVKDRFFKGSPNVIPAYVKMKNPLNTTKYDPTTFFYENEEDENGDYTGNESGNFLALHQAIIDKAYDHNVDGEEVWEDVSEQLWSIIHNNDGEITAAQVFQILKASEKIMGMTDDDGNSSSMQFFRDVIEELGHDGIIMDAWEHFRERDIKGIGPNTRHYITWDPTNIKSYIGNNGLYDPKDPKITAKTKRGTIVTSEKLELAKSLDAQGKYEEADAIDSEMEREALKCWKGYERVPGTKEGEPGSCKKKGS